MVKDPIRLVTVVGSATPPGRLRRAVEEGLARAEASGGAATRLIDLADVRIAPADGRPPEQLGDDTADVLAAIAAADAVVLATPVYRGSLTGVLKNLLDHVPVAALEGTPVGIVAMGATPHHFLGAERHLRDVLSFFGALVAPVAVYLTSSDFADGEPIAQAADDLDTLLANVAALARATAGLPLGGPRPLPRRPKP
ncbi:NADPH-dependent FMN reductase [Conexibacter woesei]|uniref:NADPH-dependent FMN reductase n=1 Tax=Conexibacter woesei (strain DSM 14684 / CCUG 47730 / CIP 108061 / JCM 11494 / NBRC 100937 / ID131577) TaxID=469383 RepID=D3FB71_CONWI|nr:NADPH-dependent FMN reductase [Conexibacter woesei]ADB53263.1 NADPH-dependent FMN reductase [Conexibacter woesei DSM 14684]